MCHFVQSLTTSVLIQKIFLPGFASTRENLERFYMLDSVRQVILVDEEIVKIQSLNISPTGWMVKLVNQAK